MKYRTFSRLLSCGLISGGLLAWHSPAQADEWDKCTVVTFHEPVEIPGMVLPPGTYVMKLFDSPSDRDVVQFFNKDETQIYRTVMAIPSYRETPTDATVIRFEERHAGAPEAMKYWYYPGDLRGEEFIYGKTNSVATAQATSVPPQPPQPPQPVAKAAPVPQHPAMQQVTAAPPPAPAPKPVEMAQAAPPPAPSNPPVATQVTTLPKTASDLPLAGLIGFASLAAGALLRRIRLTV